MIDVNTSIRKGADALLQYWFFILCCLLLITSSLAVAADMVPAIGGVKKVFLQRGAEKIFAFTVEVVYDNKAMHKGLSGRTALPDDHGMLFVFNSPGERFFWMKNMEFSVDILSFDKNKQLIEIFSNLMPCEKCEKTKMPDNTAYVLEINGGMAYSLDIRKGDILVY